MSDPSTTVALLDKIFRERWIRYWLLTARELGKRLGPCPRQWVLDLLEEAFAAAVDRAVQGSLPDAMGEERLAEYVGGIVRNMVKAFSKAERRRRKLIQHLREGATTRGSANDLYGPIETEELREAMRFLPEDQRESLVLRYWEGLTCAAIAARMGCASSRVLSLIRSGVRRLRQILDPMHRTVPRSPKAARRRNLEDSGGGDDPSGSGKREEAAERPACR